MSNWRVDEVAAGSWAIAYGDEDSGLSLYGYPTKDEAITAVHMYKQIEGEGLNIGEHIVFPPEQPRL